MIQKVGLLVCLEGNQARGSLVAQVVISEGWFWSATKGNQTRPSQFSWRKNIYIKEETKNILLNQSENDICANLTRPDMTAYRLPIH
jgi:hypothetical protein